MAEREFTMLVLNISAITIKTQSDAITVHELLEVSPRESRFWTATQPSIPVVEKWWKENALPAYVVRDARVGTAISHFRHTCFGLIQPCKPVCKLFDEPSLISAGVIIRSDADCIQAKMYCTLAVKMKNSDYDAIERVVAIAEEAFPYVTHEWIGVFSGDDKVCVVYLHFQSEADRTIARLSLSECEVYAMENIALQ